MTLNHLRALLDRLVTERPEVGEFSVMCQDNSRPKPTEVFPATRWVAIGTEPRVEVGVK